MIRIIHLSDFHLESSNYGARKKNIVEAFLCDVEKYVNSDSIIAFTGDLIDKGWKDEIDKNLAFKKFEEFFIARLRKKYPTLPIFFVPGNHDCDRSMTDSFQDIGIKSTIRSEEALTDFFAKNENKAEYFTRLKTYKDYESDFLFRGDQNKITNLETSVKFKLNQITVGIACLNSSWLCYDDSDRGKLMVGETQIFRAYEMVKECDIKVALMHHPLEFLAEFDKNIVWPLLQKKFDMLLCGHVHETDSNLIQGLQGEIMVSIASSTIAENNPLKRFSNGYTIIDFDPKIKYTVTYKKYVDESEKFVLNTDVGNDLGQIVYQLTDNSLSNTNKFIKRIEDNDDDVIAAIKLLLGKKDIGLSYEDDIKSIKTLREKILSNFDFVQEQIDEIPKLIDEFCSDLFDSIIAQDILTQSKKAEIVHLRTNEKYHWYHRSMIVSALTLSALDSKKFDQHKILLLIDFINDSEEKVWQKALTGAVLVLTFKRNIWMRFDMITTKLKFFKERYSIQKALKAISFVIEQNLYSLLITNEKVYQIPFFKSRVSNCFIPFYEKNPAIDHFLRNVTSEDASAELEFIEKVPLPAIWKYYRCYLAGGERLDGEKGNSKERSRYQLYYNYVLTSYKYFEPYLQYIYELYMFYTFYPNDNKNAVFEKEISIASTSLKDYIFNDIEKNIIQGLHYMRMKEFGTAIKHFLTVLKIKKTDYEALLNLSICFEETYRYDESIVYRKNFEKLRNENTDNLIKIAKLSKYLKRYPDSTAYVEKTLVLDPDNIKAIQLKIDVLTLQYQFADAMKVANDALAKHKKSAELYSARALIFHSISRIDEAVDDIQKAIKFDETSAMYLSIKGNFLAKTNNYDGAKLAYDKAIELDPHDSTLLFNRAGFYLNNGEYELAIDDIKSADSNGGRRFDVYLLKCHYWYIRSDYAKAHENIDKSLSLFSQNVDALCEKAFMLTREFRFSEATEIINRALKINPKEIDILLELAYLCAYQHKFSEAIKYTDEALTLNEFDVSIYENRADIFYHFKKWEESLIDINHAIAIFPHSRFYYSRATIYIELGEVSLAVSDLKRTIELDGRYTQGYVGLAECYARQGKIDLAIDCLNGMHNREQHMSHYYFGLSLVYFTISNIEKFIENLELAILHGFKVIYLPDEIAAAALAKTEIIDRIERVINTHEKNKYKEYFSNRFNYFESLNH